MLATIAKSNFYPRRVCVVSVIFFILLSSLFYSSNFRSICVKTRFIFVQLPLRPLSVLPFFGEGLLFPATLLGVHDAVLTVLASSIL